MAESESAATVAGHPRTLPILTLLLLIGAVGLVPLVVALARLKPAALDAAWAPPAGSLLLATLAFNLTFIWQELWLAIPKALTPGLSAVLYHNDHDWTGSAPIAELLQGTGAIATAVSGIAFLVAARRCRGISATMRVFAFWMAFQGLFQSLAQFAIGAVTPGNDMGRAFAYLGWGPTAHVAVLLATFCALAATGRVLAQCCPDALLDPGETGTRSFALSVGATALAVVALSIPFRLPRNPIEVVLIPGVVNLLGSAWLLLGATFVRQQRRATAAHVSTGLPAALLVLLLLFCQLVLRPGIPFG